MPQAVCRRVLQPEPCERVGAPPLNDAAGAQAHVGVGHRQQLVEPMLGYHHRGAAALELGQDAHERLGALRVQVGRGFVQHEHGRTARDGGGEGHPLLLAARQLGQLLAQKPFHAARLGGGMHAAHGALPRCEPAHVGAAHLHDARQIAGKERARQPVHQAQHGGLAVARAPAQHEAAAGSHRQRHVVHAAARCGRGRTRFRFQPPLGFVHVAKRSPVEQHGRRPLAVLRLRHHATFPHTHSPAHTASTATAARASRASNPT